MVIEQIVPLTGTNGAYEKWKNSAVAATKAVNASGGINGRELELKICDSGTNANTAAACGRQVLDDRAVGVLSISSIASFEPYIEPKKVPVLDTMVDPRMFKASNSFSIAAPGLQATFGAAATAKRAGCKKAVLVFALDLPPDAVDVQKQHFEDAANQVDLPAGAVNAPAGSPDYSSYIAAALRQGADCLVLQALGADTVALVKAARQADPETKLFSSTGYLSQDGAKSLGSLVKGISLTSSAWPASSASDRPKVADWVSEINKYSPEPKALDSNGALMWADVHLLADVAQSIDGTINAQSMYAAMSKLKDYQPGVAPAVSFAPLPDTPAGDRVFAPYALKLEYQNGEPKAVGSFFNIFTLETVK